MEEHDQDEERQYKIVTVWLIVIASCLLFWTWIAVQFMK